MKFTIVMPTYNDSESIEETLTSIKNQTYDNWELLISDDGSTDNTKEVVEKFINTYNEKRIKYFYKENSDQLNAINSVINNIDGDYVYILHSDDLFINDNILEKVVNSINEYPNYDAYLSCGSEIINDKSSVTGEQKFMDYNKSEYIMPLQLLWLGRNLYWDFAFFKTEVFKSKIKNNYLTWNIPFWLNYDNVPSMLNVKTLDYYFIKYRVFEGNYINNEIGKLNVINGELRCASKLLKYYDIPLYSIQYILFRLFNKLKIVHLYRPIYFNRESNNKYNIIKFIIKKRYKNEYKKYLFLNSIVNFFKNNKTRKIDILSIPEDVFIYKGSDMRKFNNDMLNGNLSEFYINILSEMNNGFNEVITSKKYYDKVSDILKFLCIYDHVRITIV